MPIVCLFDLGRQPDPDNILPCFWLLSLCQILSKPHMVIYYCQDGKKSQFSNLIAIIFYEQPFSLHSSFIVKIPVKFVWGLPSSYVQMGNHLSSSDVLRWPLPTSFMGGLLQSSFIAKIILEWFCDSPNLCGS